MRRLDSRRLYSALTHERIDRELTWKQVAVEVGCSWDSLRRLHSGRAPSTSFLVAALDWLDRDLADFVISGSEGENSSND